MRKRMTAGVFAAALTVGVAALAGLSAGAQQAQPAVTAYKTRTCGCCSKWIEHMRSQGFEVKAVDVDDIAKVKMGYGVPPEVVSCHTSLVGGYVVEGHVPADVIKRLLRERPKVAGIAAPGMPVGSPGMEVGSRRDRYDVVSFDRSGQRGVYERR